MTRLKRLCPGFVRRFLKEEDGAALIEFALVLPFLLTMYLAAIEFSKLDQFHSQVGKTAATVNDIVSKAPQMTADNIDAAMQAGEAIVGNWSDRLRMEVRGLNIDNAGRAVVAWSRAQNWAETAPGTVVEIPDEIAARAGFVVETRAEFDFQWKAALAVNKLPPTLIKYEYYNIPRASLQTTCPDCNANN